MSEADAESFDEKAWDEEYITNIPEIVVPAEIQDDIDNDYEEEL